MKNKNLLFLIILVTIGLIFFSGKEIYKRINLHLYGQSKEIRPMPVPVVEEEIKDTQISNIVKTEIDNSIKNSNNIENNTENEIKKDIKKENIKAIKITFEYKNNKAKNVSIAGAFSRWKNIPMKKNKNIWKADVFILPGNYLFHYNVDGKKVLDKDFPKAPVGESVIKVGN